jgi:hypothetical protein
MKVQVLDLVKDQVEGILFHFLMRLTHKANYAHWYLFHFLTSLTLKMNYDHLFNFLMILTQKANNAHLP